MKMKFNKLSTVALSLGLSAANGFSLFSKPVDFVAKSIRQSIDAKVEVIEGVALPSDTENLPIGKRLTNFLQFSKKTNIDIVKSLSFPDNISDYMEGLHETDEKKNLSKTIPVQPKRSAFFRELYTRAINEVIKVNRDDPDPAEGYLYFGNCDFKKILPMLCQVNPFFASALTLSENGKFFELKAFTDEPERVEEPLYLSFMREMVDDSHRINAKFDKKMNLVEVTKLDSDSGKAVVVPEKEWDYYSSGIIYNMLFYSSTVHANIHVLHYLMCACIIMSTRGTSDSLEKWADIYDDNIAIKYVQVGLLLFPSELDLIFNDDQRLVSGVDGFGATKKIMPKVKDLLKLWGSLKNEEDFTKKFLLNGIYSTASDEAHAEAMMEKGEILCEYKKHSNNVEPFAEELCAALKEDNPSAFADTEKSIKSFMEACGKGVSSIDSISSWTQLMCLTGILHGSTLSYTRMIVVPEVARWRNIHSDEWDVNDSNLVANGFVTVQGMTEDRHAFTSEIKKGFEWDTSKIVKPVMDVLQKYDGIADDLKVEYTKEIEERDDFREYGWILTDHCQDGYDGKQHTITTYI